MHDQEERLSRDYDYIPENHRLAIAFDRRASRPIPTNNQQPATVLS